VAATGAPRAYPMNRPKHCKNGGTARPALPRPRCYGRKPRAQARFGCCSSSVVEHSLGKGEVESSILSCSTSYLIEIVSMLISRFRGYSAWNGEHRHNMARRLVRNPCGLFSVRSAQLSAHRAFGQLVKSRALTPLMAVAPNALPINLKSAPPRAFFAGLC
jgi:hypothetical protein